MQYLRFWLYLATFFQLQFNPAYAETFRIQDLPDGYASGRTTAPYGAYNTPYDGEARTYSDKLDSIEPKIYGLSKSTADDVKQSEHVFYLENILIGFIQKISSEPESTLSRFEKESLLHRAIELYKKTRHHGERLYETMIRKVDVALPGPNGSQLRIVDGKGRIAYLSNCRSEKCPTEKEQKEFLAKKVKEFQEAGGSLLELKLADTKNIAQLPTVGRVEYVQRPNGKIWITEGNAGHAVLAHGGPVLAAGQIVFVKNKKGEIQSVIISNASGTYKPDLFSAQRLGEELARQLNIDQWRVVVTEGEPLGTQTVKVLMKAAGAPKDEIKRRVNEIEAEAKRLLNGPQTAFGSTALVRVKDCSSALSRLSFFK